MLAPRGLSKIKIKVSKITLKIHSHDNGNYTDSINTIILHHDSLVLNFRIEGKYRRFFQNDITFKRYYQINDTKICIHINDVLDKLYLSKRNRIRRISLIFNNEVKICYLHKKLGP